MIKRFGALGAILFGLVGCLDTTPELSAGSGAQNLRVTTNMVNGKGPSQLLSTRSAWLHVASLNADCSVDQYFGRGDLGSMPSMALAPGKPYAFEIIVNVKAGFDLMSKKALERSIFVRPGYSYILNAQLAPNNDLVDLYEVSPTGAKRRVDSNYSC